jgi:predicted transglutaminase-like cysteine proteinase
MKKHFHKAKICCAGLAASAFFGFSQTKAETAPQIFSIAGYVPVSAPDSPPNLTAAAEQKRYLAQKTLLQAVLVTCAQPEQSCRPEVREFAAMLDLAHLLPDRLEKILLINAWINLAITYDFNEEKKSHSNDDHRTMLMALLQRHGVCDEQSMLKLFALEAAGFPPGDVMYVDETVYDDGRIKKIGTATESHAVAMVRIADSRGTGTVWALNNQLAEIPPSAKTYPRIATSLISQMSMAETDFQQTNLSNMSSLNRADAVTNVPLYGFNSVLIAIYSDKAWPDRLKSVPVPAASKDFTRNNLTRVFALDASGRQVFTQALLMRMDFVLASRGIGNPNRPGQTDIAADALIPRAPVYIGGASDPSSGNFRF